MNDCFFRHERAACYWVSAQQEAADCFGNSACENDPQDWWYPVTKWWHGHLICRGANQLIESYDQKLFLTY